MPEAAFVHSSSPRSQRRASSVHSSPYPQALRRHHCPRLVAALKSSTPKLHSLIAARQPNVASGAIKCSFRPVPTSAESSRLKACGHHRLPPIIQSPSAILQSSNPPILHPKGPSPYTLSCGYGWTLVGGSESRKMPPPHRKNLKTCSTRLYDAP